MPTHPHSPAAAKASAVYVRLTGGRQGSRPQEDDLRGWAASQAAPLAWYRDDHTLPSAARPGFEALLADVRARGVARVVVWRVDRLGLTCRGLVAFVGELDRCRV